MNRFLRLATGGQYEVTDTIRSSSTESVFSPDHPNATRWYDQKNAWFLWNTLPSTTYRYQVDQNATAIPPLSALPTSTDQAAVSVPADGIYYFHLEPITNGIPQPIISYKIQIDTTPPTPPIVQVSTRTVHTGDIARISFSSTDALSGLQDNFYVKIGDSLFLPTKPPLDVPALEKGTLPIIVRAFDRAGNYSDSSTTISIQ